MPKELKISGSIDPLFGSNLELLRHEEFQARVAMDSLIPALGFLLQVTLQAVQR